MILFLPQPAERIRQIDADPVALRFVLTPAMKDAARVDQHRAPTHFCARYFFRLRLTIVGPIEASGTDLGRTVFFPEIGECPDRVELRLDMFEVGSPGPAVAVDGLRGLTGSNPDDLGEVELNSIAVGCEKLVRGRENRRVNDHLATCRTTRSKRAGPCRMSTYEAVGSSGCRFDVGHHIVEGAVDFRGGQNVFEDQSPIASEHLGDFLSTGLGLQSSQFRHDGVSLERCQIAADLERLRAARGSR